MPQGNRGRQADREHGQGAKCSMRTFYLPSKPSMDSDASRDLYLPCHSVGTVACPTGGTATEDRPIQLPLKGHLPNSDRIL